MGSMNVNINSLYRAVRNVGENDTHILEPLEGGGWQITQAENLSPDQKDANLKFRNGLYDSLKGMTGDEDVLKDLRSTLGIPEKTEEDKKPDADKLLTARDIKNAIELVMRKVDGRIGAILTTKFPPAVQQLIREAVRENPQHMVVRAFLSPASTVDDLAKLCRLTFQSQKGTADSQTLAYLDGFAYKVADFSDVSMVNAHDKAQYDAGRTHYDREVGKFDFKAFCDQLGNDFQSKNLSKKDVFAPFVEALRADTGGDFSTRIQRFLTESRRDVLDGLTADADLLAELNSEIRNQVCQKNAFTKDDVIGILEKSVDEARIAIKKPKVFAEAVKLCETEIKNLKDTIASENRSVLRKQSLEALLPFVSEPLKHQADEPYTTASKVYTSGMRNQKGDEAVAKDVAEVIKTVIAHALDEKDLGEPGDVVLTDPKSHNAPYGKNTLLTQGGTNMCYLRSLENALLEKEKSLPKPVNGTYTFNVTFANGENEKGEKLTFTRQITVDADEIEALKDWYGKNQELEESYGKQKNDLTDLDWAVNIAQAKQTAVQNILDGEGDDESKKVEKAKVYELEKLTAKTISVKAEEGKYNVTDQVITKPGHDDAVAALFGLTSQPESISINHVGYVPDLNQKQNLQKQQDLQKQKLQQYMLSEGEDLKPESLYANFNAVREWKKANPDGILTLNEAGRHFVAVTGFYFNSDADFGFIVRDSNKAENKESKVNVVGYVYDGVNTNGNCHKLSVHCYPAPAKPAA